MKTTSMRRWLFRAQFFIFLLIISTFSFSQGIELYGGYPYRFNTDKFNPTYVKGFKNGNNWEAGGGMSIFIRPVLLQTSLGYLSHNFTSEYTGVQSVSKRAVYGGYVLFSLGVYPKIYADGKNVFSIGVGGNLLFPTKDKAIVSYTNGNTSVEPTEIFPFVVIIPRTAFRYSYWLGKGLYLHGSIYTDFTAMPTYEEVSASIAASYYHFKVTLGANAGIGYFIHRKKGIQKPVYFEPWKKREKKEGGKR